MEDFYTFLEIIIILAVGYHVGEFIAVMRMLNLFERMTGREIEVEDIERLGTDEEHVLEVARSMMFKTETIDDELYLYTVDQSNFVCQASTLEELCKRCKEYTKLTDVFVFHEKQAYHYDGEVIEKVKHED
jgi:hypothetical protein